MGTMRHGRGQQGAISPEYVAGVLVIASLVAVVIALGLPTTVGSWGATALCRLFDTGDDCAEPALVAGDAVVDPAIPPPPPPCVVESDAWTRQTTTDWLFDRSLSGTRFGMTRLSDGSVVIVDTEFEGEGSVLGAGLELADLGLTAHGSRTDLREEGRMFVLDEAAFADYQDTMGQLAVEAYTSGGALADLDAALGAEDVEGFIAGLEAMEIKQQLREQLIEQHVTHDYYRTSSEIEVQLGASVPIPDTPIVVGGAVGGSGERSTVVAVDRETGARSLTWELAASAEMQAMVSAYVVGVERGVAGDGSYSMTVELDEDGAVREASITARLQLEGGATEVGLDLGVPDTPGSGATADLVGLGGGAGLAEVTFAVPVDDAVTAGSLATVLRDPAGEMDTFGALARDHGEVLLQGYDTTESGGDVGLALRLLASAGISAEDSHVAHELRGAVSYDPANGWLDRSDCL